MSDEVKKQAITIPLQDRIDSNNAADVETAIVTQVAEQETAAVVLDAEDLEYISSAGLRVLLHLKKMYSKLRITNVHSDVYEILEMTGFTEMMQVEKAYRVVSVEGCEEIGRGANGTIYRIDQDNVVKVYNNADALADIQHEREVAKLALILGIPTAISYDVVKVGESYGSVFELLNARSFSKILATEPDKMDWCVDEFVAMLKTIHGTVVPEGKLPDMRETALDWARFMQDYLPEEASAKLLALVEAVPYDGHMIHGDYHTKNLELQNDEVLLIDMDTLAVGHPVFELASMYNAFVGFSELDHTVIERFQGFGWDTAQIFWHKTLAAYLGTEDIEAIRETENKARIIGYTRLIRRSIRRNGMDTDAGRAEIDYWKGQLLALLEKTESLTFDQSNRSDGGTMHTEELEIEAVVENLPKVLAFIERNLEKADCNAKESMQITMAAEEIFVNIAHYAYAPEKGNATVRVEISEAPVVVTLTFIDHGVPYDPLAKQDPDVTLSAEERQIGGLGIFLVKETMDEVAYEYHEGRNILQLKKNL